MGFALLGRIGEGSTRTDRAPCNSVCVLLDDAFGPMCFVVGLPVALPTQYPNRPRQVTPVPVDKRKLTLWKTQRNIYLLVVAEFSASVAQRCLSTPESSAVSLR